MAQKSWCRIPEIIESSDSQRMGFLSIHSDSRGQGAANSATRKGLYTMTSASSLWLTLGMGELFCFKMSAFSAQAAPRGQAWASSKELLILLWEAGAFMWRILGTTG